MNSKILTLLCIIAYSVAIVFISLKNIKFGIVFVFAGALLFFALLTSEWIVARRHSNEKDEAENKE